MNAYDRNKYFIVNLPGPAIKALLEHTVAKGLSKCRKSLDGKKTLLKLPIDLPKPVNFTPHKEYTHKEIKVILSTKEWNDAREIS